MASSIRYGRYKVSIIIVGRQLQLQLHLQPQSCPDRQGTCSLRLTSSQGLRGSQLTRNARVEGDN